LRLDGHLDSIAPYLCIKAKLRHSRQHCARVSHVIAHGKRKSRWRAAQRGVRLTTAQHGVPRVSAAAVDKSEATREKERKQIEQYRSLEKEVAEKVGEVSCDSKYQSRLD